MTNKPMLSVERELLERALSSVIVARGPGSPTERDLRALLDKPAYPNRLCHADYTPYICGCLKGDEEAQRRFDEHQAKAAQHQGEPVASMPVDRCYDVRAKMIIAFNEAKKAGGDLDDALDAAYKSALRYSPNPMTSERPAPVAVVMPERSSQDYAIEHAEYMTQSADDVLAKFQAYGLALLAVDEGGDDGEGELLEAIDTARGDLQESLVDLRSMVYEFRKRSNRCTSL